MPFIAKLKQTGKRIDIADYRNPKAELRFGDIVCQFEDCCEELYVRDGIVRPHFAHKPETPCRTVYKSHPESDYHRIGKRFIADHELRKLKARGFSDVTIELEVAVPEARRVADVMVTYPMGWRDAHECQLASITTQELKDRTSSYENQGITVFWWFGEGSQADNQANRLWAEHHQGGHLLLRFTPESDAGSMGPAPSR